MFKKIALIAIALMGMTYNTATMANEQPGWKIDKLDVHNNVIGIKNIGDQGGVMKLTCDIETGRINLTYSQKGKVYDFFVLRRFGDNLSAPGTKLLIGSATMTQAQLYAGLGGAKGGYEIEFYPVGTKAIWDTNIRTANVEAKYTPEGYEFFITGTGLPQSLIDMTKSCALDEGDSKPRY